jgi:DNA-binding transcriptional regulator LsrR (DeoR family)
MNDEISLERQKLLADIAEYYYNEGLSQQEIADRVNMSRPSISRLLIEARDYGIVKIDIEHPIPVAIGLEAKLKKIFSLRSAHVLERGISTESEALNNFGRLGAQILINSLKDGMVLGVSWGTTVHAVVSGLRATRLPHVKVVQLLGGVGSPYASIDGPEQVRRIGELLNAQHYYLNAPMLVDTPEAATALREDHSIKEVLELAQQSDVALVGIGSIIPEVSTQYHSGYLTYENLRLLEKQGVVGAMCSSFFDIDGNFISVPWCDQCSISVNWDDLKKIPTVIGIATGKRKAPAILGAIRSKIVDILVTDDITVEEIINLAEES